MALIFQAATPGDADLHIALMADPGMADLWVHRVATQGQAAGDALWFITRDRHVATARVWFGSPGMCQARIAFVDSRGLAGWRRPHVLRGRFG